MFKEDSCFTSLKYWHKYKPEEELYNRLQNNPIWPFKQVSDGHFNVAYRSDRVTFGSIALITAIISFALILLILDYCELALGYFITFFFFGCWALYGQLGWRELVINTKGKGKYTIRMLQNKEVLSTNEIRNVYIRLARKIDSQNDPHFFLVIGGNGVDDIRMTRMTRAEGAMKIMGMRLAYRLGINFFDWKNESEEHLVWHYKTHSRKIKKTKDEKERPSSILAASSLPDIRVTTQDHETQEHHHSRHHHHHHHHHHHRHHHQSPLRTGEADETRRLKSVADDENHHDDDKDKRKVRINQQVGVRRVSSKKE